MISLTFFSATEKGQKNGGEVLIGVYCSLVAAFSGLINPAKWGKLRAYTGRYLYKNQRHES